MSKLPYFTVSANSFEKNAGYKTTVHAINEIIDNAYEADAKDVSIILQVNTRQNLTSIAIANNGKGMVPELLQSAVCEKSGTNMDRQNGSGHASRAKYGKYGVGLPKASISQCNKFSVFSWVTGGPQKSYCNSIDITDQAWIAEGAQVDVSQRKKPESGLLKVAGADDWDTGTIVLWEKLDGVSWTRARMGNNGLAPNLDFMVGRIYRKPIAKGDFNIRVIICDANWSLIEELKIKPNDPLYLMEETEVPRLDIGQGKIWPPEVPLFEPFGEEFVDFEIELKNGEKKVVKIAVRASMARKNVFATYNGRSAGSLPHGKHAKRNVGISLLREGREVELSTVLSNVSEPRERWIGLEVDIPHELDELFGMTNNKQAYTRLDTLLKMGVEAYLDGDETTDQCMRRMLIEDPNNGNCLKLAKEIQDKFKETWGTHRTMREETLGGTKASDVVADDSDGPFTPEDTAVEIGTRGDSRQTPVPVNREEEIERYANELAEQGIPTAEAKSIAARIINRGLKYSVVRKSGLGMPFFNARKVIDTYLLEMNTDHEFFTKMSPFLGECSENDDSRVLWEKLNQAKAAFFLMLEAWIKLEIEADPKHRRRMESIRTDWGRMISDFLDHQDYND